MWFKSTFDNAYKLGLEHGILRGRFDAITALQKILLKNLENGQNTISLHDLETAKEELIKDENEEK